MRKKLTSNGESPLLLDDTGFIFTKRKFRECIQQAIEKLDPAHKDAFKDLKGHSLRSGVPTALQQLGRVCSFAPETKCISFSFVNE